MLGPVEIIIIMAIFFGIFLKAYIALDERGLKKDKDIERRVDERGLKKDKDIERREKLEKYRRLLKDGRWLKRRQDILNRDGHKCVKCGSSSRLQVHHKFYEKFPNGEMVDPWDYPDHVMETLCEDCHRKAHRRNTKVYFRRFGEHYSNKKDD